jgi:hypothetical protein
MELEQQLAAVTRQRDELVVRLAEVSSERDRLAQQVNAWLLRGGPDRSEEE